MGRMRKLCKKYISACDDAGAAVTNDYTDPRTYAVWKRMATLLVAGESILASDVADDGSWSYDGLVATRSPLSSHSINVRAIILEHLCRQERKERGAIKRNNADLPRDYATILACWRYNGVITPVRLVAALREACDDIGIGAIAFDDILWHVHAALMSNADKES